MASVMTAPATATFDLAAGGVRALNRFLHRDVAGTTRVVVQELVEVAHRAVREVYDFHT